LLPDFFERCPEVEIDCVIGHAVVDLTRREADIAVRFIAPTTPDLVWRPLGAISVEPFVHPRLADLPLDELRWLMLADPDGRFEETHWIEQHARPKQTLNISLCNALFAGVKAGLGAGLLAPFVAEPAGLVRPVGSHPPGPSHTLFMVYHRAMRDVPRLAAFRQWLVEHAAPVVQA
jgi:DNA-binding transcriptional LysR family regulator